MQPLSYLFVPATRIDRITKAFAAGAHAVIVDLEDAVDSAAKPEARRQLQQWLSTDVQTPAVWVRINASATPWFTGDLSALAGQPRRVAGLMLAKTESPADLDAVQDAFDAQVPVLPLIETARGLLALRDISAHACVRRLAFGSADLSRDLGCEDSWELMLPARAQLVLHSAAAGLPPPVDGVSFSIEDVQRVSEDARRAASAGFGGKLCIHPAQLAPTHAGFAPSQAELDWARRMLAAGAAGTGAQRVQGHLVDRPVLERANQILQRHALAIGAALAA